MGAFFGFQPPTTPGTSNNAPRPLPTPGSTGVGVPTGGVSGGVAGPQLYQTPSSNMNPFSNSSGIQSLNSGLTAGTNMTQLNYMLNKAFGSGTGSLLSSIFSGGLFNPGIAEAMLGAMQPGINQGTSAIQQSFGAEGSRFGSASALGLGNYLSQVNLNEQSTLANMFQNSQQEELSLLNNILPTIHGEKANSGGILSDILGGLEAAGGLIAAPFTGGLTLPLVAAGIGTITGGNKGGGGGQQQSPYMPLTLPQTQAPQSTPPFIAPGTTIDPTTLQDVSAGATLGGADPFGGGSSSDPSDYSNLFPLLMGK